MSLQSLDKEKQIVILLSKAKLVQSEVELLITLLNTHMNWSTVVGLLQTHRLVGIAWGNVSKYLISEGIDTIVFSKLLNFLRNMHTVQYEKAQTQCRQLLEICEEFEKHDIKYCILKGIVLSEYGYNDAGARDFNDNDILIHPNQIKEAITILEQKGYVQGKISLKEKTVIPVQRKETLFWSMVSHEVHPLILKLDDNKFLDFHIVDLQYSIDLNTANRTDLLVDRLLRRRIQIDIKGSSISTLTWEDMLVFVCHHFYKEAISYRDVQSYRDLLLYKICDIANLIVSKKIEIDWDTFIQRAKELNVTNGVYFALHYTNLVYTDIVPYDVLNTLKPDEINYLHEVYNYDSDTLAIQWDDNIIDRIFDMNRPSRIIKLHS
ncbi:nucleotidyltransferase domain-containing protein [Brevibacillus centrosporus]|uniref:Uncharacterized nucleotidyltransferase n=1 Tax=Brevibacillus centrosporus TaxID=54910 RepID=A0A1I4E3M6_9BACL|nr:nucleotidyltransferase family protein [Brevibacillus centrosporus]SFK99863.1 Uncharacterised nucleotidyltransferase [Brevibacillus centrosporus]